MFTKDDFIEYFGQLAAIEREMIYELQDTLVELDDSRIWNLLDSVLKDECRHYSYIKDLLETIFLKNAPKPDKSVGIHSLGTARVHELKTKKNINGYCIRVTQNDVYIELERRDPFSGPLDVEVIFFNGSLKRHCTGTMKWYVQVTKDVMMVKVGKNSKLRS